MSFPDFEKLQRVVQAPVEQQVGSLRIDGPGASLMDADALPRPAYGPTLGPQEIEVSLPLME